MTIPRYLNYRASGAEWLGEVPEHWEVQRIGYYFEERREKVSDKAFAALSVTKNGIVPQLDSAAKTDDGDNRKMVRRGDFVINSRSDRKGSAGVSEFDGSVSLICTVMRPLGRIYAPFVHHLLRCQRFQEEFYRNGKGIVADLWSTGYSEMRNILVGMPPLPEQVQIAEYLSHQTSRIDELVLEQRRLMVLLQEKRQALISHAVTKGLNRGSPMKPSGIEWLGDVPKHWEVGRLKTFFQTSSGGTPDTAKQDLYYATADEGIPWIRTTDLKNDVLRNAEVFITEQALIDTACKILPVGTVMVAMYGGEGTIGKNGLLAIPAAINQAVCGVLPSPTHCPEFVFRYMQFIRPYWMIGAESSRKDPNISQERVRNAPILRPPREEQEAIARYLEERVRSFDTLLAQAERVIELLLERRSALISSAVTGKIDLRGFNDREAA